MAKKTKNTKVVKNPPRGRAKASRPARAPAPTPKRRPQTPEQKRGGQFARHLKVLAAIHKNHGGKPFNKRMLGDWLRDEFDRDIDEWSAWYAATAAAQGASSAAPPVGLETIQEASRDRNAERAIKSLQMIGIEIERTDESGKPYKKKKPKPPRGKKSKPKKSADGTSSNKVWWKYDPAGPVSTDLQRLFTDFKLTGYELEGIMGCTALLENFYGLPMEAQVRKVFDRITSRVPARLLREAAEQGVVWRYLFRRPGKYEPKKKILQAWNDATILRKQCSMTYAPAELCWVHHLRPDALPAQQPRRIAAFGTIFIAEEDSIYLVGCERDKRDPDKWQRPVLYKFDRVIDLRMEDEENPSLADMPSHPRVEPIKGAASRLDLEKLFTDSSGAFFHYGKTHTLVVRVHDPAQIALCLERPFHRRQRVEVGPDRDEITLTVDSCFLDEVIPRLLAMKGGFTVQQPAELALAIRDMAHAVASRHGPAAAVAHDQPR